jgi:hypothetical protein
MDSTTNAQCCGSPQGLIVGEWLLGKGTVDLDCGDVFSITLLFKFGEEFVLLQGGAAPQKVEQGIFQLLR